MRSMMIFFVLWVAVFPVSSMGGDGVFPYLEDPDVCELIKKQLPLGDSKNIFRPNSNAQKKVFVGSDRNKYNPNDYYLWVDSYDVSNDGVDDLIAFDWVKKTKRTFYLAMYVYPGKGGFYLNKQMVGGYFLSRKLSSRHGEGDKPLVPELFFIKKKGEVAIEEVFVGFHEINPVLINGVSYLVAEKSSGKNYRALVFRLKKNNGPLGVICRF